MAGFFENFLDFSNPIRPFETRYTTSFPQISVFFFFFFFFFLKNTWIRYTKQVDAEEERAKEKGISWKTVTRSLSDYSLVQDACWYFVTYLCSSLLDYHVRTARSEGHTRFFPFVPSRKKLTRFFSLSRFPCVPVLFLTRTHQTHPVPYVFLRNGRGRKYRLYENGER